LVSCGVVECTGERAGGKFDEVYFEIGGKSVFAQNIYLKSTEANLFWEIYDLYEEEFLPIGNRRAAILQKILAGEGKLNETDADRLIKEDEY